MATLSANSRRNSAASSVSSSPRPSLTGTAAITSVPPVHMSSLNEEEYVEPNEDHTDKAIRVPRDNICTERSDSGFSDCSNSSGNAASNGNALVAHPLFDKANSISEEKSAADANHSANNTNLKEMCGKVSVNMLKMKLEKIAETQSEPIAKPPPIIARRITNGNDEISANPLTNSMSATFEVNALPATVSPVSTEHQEKPIRTTLGRSTSLQLKKVVDKEPIMKSDFTNTIKMRKKSLESNVLRDKQPMHSSPRALLESSGKVSKLLQRFSNESSSLPAKDFTEKMSQENALIECISTPLTAIAVAQQQVVVAKSSTVSSMSVKRSPMQERKIRNAVVVNPSMDRKSVFKRLSPTRPNSSPTNPRPIANASQSIATSPNHTKKSLKLNTVESAGTIATGTSNGKSAVAATIAQKSTAYASFNRTSPVRLSGRVKMVTDRLSTPKTTSIKKPITIRPAANPPSQTKSNGQSTNVACESSMSTTAIVTPTSITSTETMRQMVTNTMSIENYQKFVTNKDDGDFAAKSKRMNENFKKASAFWKTT